MIGPPAACFLLVPPERARDARVLLFCLRLAGAVLLAALLIPAWRSPTPARACQQPDRWAIAAAFDEVANGIVRPAGVFAADAQVPTVPPSLLKAVGWVESNWRQITAGGRPVVSFDFGYGIMQVTSGMPGAFGSVRGDLDPGVASRVASDYRYNIAFGLRILLQKWNAVPTIGTRDPAVIEDWYYALWAYNGWGYVNNPNNPRFSRAGTPANHPGNFPYQERVLYLVAHPPRDAQGNPLWTPVHVSLPARAVVGATPGPFMPRKEHREAPPPASAVYQPAQPDLSAPGSTQPIIVRVTNTGTQPWLASGTSAISLTYHLFAADGDPWHPFSPFTKGVLAYGQHPVSVLHDVLPGRSITMTIPVQAPATPGKYRLVWDLEEGQTSWFSQQGVLPRASPWIVSANPPSDGTTPTPTATSGPGEDLRFVADTSVPDGSVVVARQLFVKGWLVFNGGQLAWDGGWHLVHLSGPNFGKKLIAVPVTSSCRTANILVSLRAPARAGPATSVWQLEDPAGTPVGEMLTVVVNVRSGPPSIPSPTPLPVPATPVKTPGPTPTATAVG